MRKRSKGRREEEERKIGRPTTKDEAVVDVHNVSFAVDHNVGVVAVFHLFHGSWLMEEKTYSVSVDLDEIGQQAIAGETPHEVVRSARIDQ